MKHKINQFIPNVIITILLYVLYIFEVNYNINDVNYEIYIIIILTLICIFSEIIYYKILYKSKKTHFSLLINFVAISILECIHWGYFTPHLKEGHYTPEVLIFPILIIFSPLFFQGISIIISKIIKQISKKYKKP